MSEKTKKQMTTDDIGKASALMIARSAVQTVLELFTPGCSATLILTGNAAHKGEDGKPEGKHVTMFILHGGMRAVKSEQQGYENISKVEALELALAQAKADAENTPLTVEDYVKPAAQKIDGMISRALGEKMGQRLN